jgi:hypothetical protein
VSCLEVEAQDSSVHRKKETFAAGSDIHSVAIPLEVRDTEFRPGAIPPEMPDLLVGSRPDRVCRARALHARATAVAEETRNLITLEAEDAFLRWEQATLQRPPAKEAVDAGETLANDLSKDFRARLKVKVDEVVTAQVLAAQARATYTEYLYNQILALIDIERVTGGAFCAGFDGAVLPAAAAANGKAGTR